MTARKSILQTRSASRPGPRQPRTRTRLIDLALCVAWHLPRTGTARATIMLSVGLASAAGFVQSGFTTPDNLHPYGLASHKPSQPYLSMPHEAGGKMPRLLSQT